jgi:hypothetical protein
MKTIAAWACVVLCTSFDAGLAGLPRAERAVPTTGTGATTADFVPAENRRFYYWADQPRYWGAAVDGWHLGLAPLGEAVPFVDGGGHGESVRLSLDVFKDDGDWRRWARFEWLNLTVTVSADGLPDHVVAMNNKSGGFRGDSTGSAWRLPIELPLHPMHERWGRLPERVVVVATLSVKGLPAASTGGTPVALSGLSKERATWMQRVGGVRKGQTRAEVEAQLGRATSREAFEPRPDFMAVEGFRYPNPEAAAEEEPGRRWTVIYYDAQGRYVGHFHTMFGC